MTHRDLLWLILLLTLLAPAPAELHAAPIATGSTLEAAKEETAEQIGSTVGRLKKRASELARRAPIWGLALGVIAVFAFLARLVAALTRPYSIFSKSTLVQGILAQIAATGLFLVGVLLALELLEATALVGAVLGAAGVVGLALGFAFRDILENYLASILLALRRPFSAGDHVVVDGHEGKVMRLTTREAILMTLEGNHLRLPSAFVFKAVILNYTKNPLRQLNFMIGLGTQENVAAAQRIGVTAMGGTPGVASDPPPFSRITGLGDFTVNVCYFAWVDQRNADWFKVQSECIRRVKIALDEAGVDMPTPTQIVELGRAQPKQPKAFEPIEEAVEDVRPDDHLERQMRTERTESDEENLLGA